MLSGLSSTVTSSSVATDGLSFLLSLENTNASLPSGVAVRGPGPAAPPQMKAAEQLDRAFLEAFDLRGTPATLTPISAEAASSTLHSSSVIGPSDELAELAEVLAATWYASSAFAPSPNVALVAPFVRAQLGANSIIGATARELMAVATSTDPIVLFGAQTAAYAALRREFGGGEVIGGRAGDTQQRPGALPIPPAALGMEQVRRSLLPRLGAQGLPHVEFTCPHFVFIASPQHATTTTSTSNRRWQRGPMAGRDAAALDGDEKIGSEEPSERFGGGAYTDVDAQFGSIVMDANGDEALRFAATVHITNVSHIAQMAPSGRGVNNGSGVSKGAGVNVAGLNGARAYPFRVSITQRVELGHSEECGADPGARETDFRCELDRDVVAPGDAAIVHISALVKATASFDLLQLLAVVCVEDTLKVVITVTIVNPCGRVFGASGYRACLIRGVPAMSSHLGMPSGDMAVGGGRGALGEEGRGEVNPYVPIAPRCAPAFLRRLGSLILTGRRGLGALLVSATAGANAVSVTSNRSLVGSGSPPAPGPSSEGDANSKQILADAAAAAAARSQHTVKVAPWSPSGDPFHSAVSCEKAVAAARAIDEDGNVPFLPPIRQPQRFTDRGGNMGRDLSPHDNNGMEVTPQATMSNPSDDFVRQQPPDVAFMLLCLYLDRFPEPFFTDRCLVLMSQRFQLTTGQYLEEFAVAMRAASGGIHLVQGAPPTSHHQSTSAAFGGMAVGSSFHPSAASFSPSPEAPAATQSLAAAAAAVLSVLTEEARSESALATLLWLVDWCAAGLILLDGPPSSVVPARQRHFPSGEVGDLSAETAAVVPSAGVLLRREASIAADVTFSLRRRKGGNGSPLGNLDMLVALLAPVVACNAGSMGNPDAWGLRKGATTTADASLLSSSPAKAAATAPAPVRPFLAVVDRIRIVACTLRTLVWLRMMVAHHPATHHAAAPMDGSR